MRTSTRPLAVLLAVLALACGPRVEAPASGDPAACDRIWGVQAMRVGERGLSVEFLPSYHLVVHVSPGERAAAQVDTRAPFTLKTGGLLRWIGDHESQSITLRRLDGTSALLAVEETESPPPGVGPRRKESRECSLRRDWNPGKTGNP